MMIVTLCSCMALSCNQELIHDAGYGYLGVGLKNDISEDFIVKSDPSAEPSVFSVEVFDPSGNSVAKADDHTQVTADNPIKLPVGTYSVVASNGVNADAAFDSPYYEGRQSVKILPDRINSITIDCSLANTVFSVEFPEDFAEHFDVYEVAVTNGAGSRLVLSNTPQSGNPLEAGFSSEAYFKVTGTLTWELYLQNKDHSAANPGGIYRTSATYTDVKAREHYHLKFQLGEDDMADGAFTIKVSLDSKFDDTKHDIILDFDNRYLPTVGSNDEFGAQSSVSVPVVVESTLPKILSFETPVGLKSLRSSHSDPALLQAGLPENVEYAGADDALLSSLEAAGISVSQHTLSKAVNVGAQGASVDMTDFIAKLNVGSYAIDFTLVDALGHFDVFHLVFEVISDVDAEASLARIGWAAFAQLEGRYFTAERPEGLTFRYRKHSDTDWIEVPLSQVKFYEGEMRYTAIISGLEPLTQYVFRAVSAEDKETKEMTFTTSAAGVLHNLSFDNWSDSDKYPNAGGYAVWDSANSSGATTTTTPSDDTATGKGKAARLESIKKFGVLAAGNIFTGSFGNMVIQGTTAGASLNWGTPFTSRPIALRGWYKYSPATINMVKDPYKALNGQPDQSQILMFLTDWGKTFEVNTVTQHFVDLDNDPGIIALGQFNSSVKDNGYVRFTIPLVYRDNKRIPTHVVIAAAASRYGDYFTGGVGSVLLLDELEFVYDPAELSEEEFSKVFSRVTPF